MSKKVLGAAAILVALAFALYGGWRDGKEHRELTESSSQSTQR